MALKLPLGTSHFEKMVLGAYTWVDKSLFIQEIIEDPSEAILITRPRRFGKTMNLSMLFHFLSNHPKRMDGHFFESLAIAKQAPDLMAEQGNHPTVFISLRELAQATNLDDFWTAAQSLVQKTYLEFDYLQNSPNLQADDNEIFQTLSKSNPPRSLVITALTRLMRMLYNHWGQRVWLLVDEFDAPIHAGYEAGYYDEAIAFTRMFLCTALKDSPHLEKTVITGIFRVAKESLFSGANNIVVHPPFGEKYAPYFGFSEQEVVTLLQQTQIHEQLKSVKAWYNGYRMGNHTLYNPWSIIHFIANRQFGAYWVNTNDNSLIKRLLLQHSEGVRSNLEQLLNADSIHVEISEHTTFPELNQDPSMVWNLLYFAGYLTGHPIGMGAIRLPYELSIPNLEVRALIQEIVKTWLHQSLSHADTQLTVNAILTGDAANLELGLGALIRESMSFWDTQEPQPERVYHAFVLGLLVHLKSTYHVRSNRESGYGRYDVMLIPRQPQQPGIVLEFKRCSPDEDLRLGAEDALAQIDKRAYATELLEHGADPIYALGIAFRGKEVTVASASSFFPNHGS